MYVQYISLSFHVLYCIICRYVQYCRYVCPKHSFVVNRYYVQKHQGESPQSRLGDTRSSPRNGRHGGRARKAGDLGVPKALEADEGVTHLDYTPTHVESLKAGEGMVTHFHYTPT